MSDIASENIQINLSFNDNFIAEFKKQVVVINNKITKMIGNGYCFSCFTLDIAKSYTEKNQETEELESVTVFPSTTDISLWLTGLFAVELKYTPLSEKALEGLKKKGLTPKKQPIEILNIIICNSSTDVIILQHDPHNIFSDEGSKLKVIPAINPFTEKDIIMQTYFDNLKQKGIYKVEEDDE